MQRQPNVLQFNVYTIADATAVLFNQKPPICNIVVMRMLIDSALRNFHGEKGGRREK